MITSMFSLLAGGATAGYLSSGQAHVCPGGLHRHCPAPHRHGRVGTGSNAGAGGLSCIDPGGGGAVGKRHRTIGVKNCAATTYCGFGVKKSAVYASRTKNNKNFCRKVAI